MMGKCCINGLGFYWGSSLIPEDCLAWLEYWTFKTGCSRREMYASYFIRSCLHHTVDGRNPASPWMVKNYEQWDKPPINWCRIFSIHRSMALWDPTWCQRPKRKCRGENPCSVTLLKSPKPGKWRIGRLKLHVSEIFILSSRGLDGKDVTDLPNISQMKFWYITYKST